MFYCLNFFFQLVSHFSASFYSKTSQKFSILLGLNVSSLIFLLESSISPPHKWNNLLLQPNTMGTSVSTFMKNPAPMKYKSIDSPQMKKNSVSHGGSS